MIDLTKEELECVIEILNRYVPECEIRIFGSRYKGGAKKYSDLDIAIVGDKKLDVLTMANIRYEFEESNIPFRIDIMDWNVISPEFKKVIIEGGYELINI